MSFIVNYWYSYTAKSLLEQFNEYEFNANSWKEICKKLPGLNNTTNSVEITNNCKKLKKIFLKIGKANEPIQLEDINTIKEVMKFAEGLNKGKWYHVFLDNVIKPFEAVQDAISKREDWEGPIQKFNIGWQYWRDQKNVYTSSAEDCLEILSLIIAQKLCDNIINPRIVQPFSSVEPPLKDVGERSIPDTNTNLDASDNLDNNANNENHNLNVLENARKNLINGKYELEDMKNVIQVIRDSYQLNCDEFRLLHDLRIKIQIYDEYQDNLFELYKKYLPDVMFFDVLQFSYKVIEQNRSRKTELEEQLKKGSVKPKKKEMENINQKIKETEDIIRFMEEE